MAYTIAGAKLALQSLFGTSGSSSIYMALYTEDGNEVPITNSSSQTTGYARLPLGLQASTGNKNMVISSDTGILSNEIILFFNEPLVNWTTSSNKINAFKLYTTATGGTCLYEGDVKDASTSTVGVEVTSGHIFFIRVGQFTISIDSASVNAGE